jgi:integrase
VIAIRVEDIAPNGYALARAIVRQRKTGRPVRFELTEQTHQAVDDYLKATGKVAGEFLFTSRRRLGEAMTTWAVRAARHRVDCGDRIGPAHLWHAVAPPHEGDVDLPSHWPHEHGKYGPVSGNRGR